MGYPEDACLEERPIIIGECPGPHTVEDAHGVMVFASAFILSDGAIFLADSREEVEEAIAS